MLRPIPAFPLSAMDSIVVVADSQHNQIELRAVLPQHAATNTPAPIPNT